MHLNISGCSLYAENCGDLIRSLCSLSCLQYLNIADNPDAIDDTAVTTLISNMKSLQRLDISGNIRVTDISLSAIALHAGDRLLSLSASKNVLLTHIGAHMITAHCRNLKSLDLSHCPLVTSLGVIMTMSDGQLSFASRSLITVNLDGCSNLTTEP